MTESVFASSVLILSVLLLRALPGGRVSARLVYALWLPVALRLLIPWSLPVSGFSAVPASALRSTEAALSEPAGPLPSYVPFEKPVSGGPAGMVSHTVSAGRTDPRTASTTRGGLLRIIWYLGMLAVGGAAVLSNARFYLRLRRIRRRLDIAAPCPVYAAEGLPSPCLYGRAVYLPSPLEGEQLRYVLAHELTHLRHGDFLWAVLTSVCVTVYWFCPLVWLAAALSRRDCELACDEGALARLDPQERIAYGRTLLALADQRRPADLLCHATMMSKSAMHARIRRIAAQPRTRAAAVLLLAAGLTVACAASYTSPDRFVSREVRAAVRAGCRSDSPAERAAWEAMRDEFLPRYRETVASLEDGPVRLEAVRLRLVRLGLALGSEYDTFFWDLRPERALDGPVLEALGLREARDDREWPLWYYADIAERTDADGNRTVTDEHTYYLELRSEFEELEWPDIELYVPSDDFSEVARAFLTAIGEIRMSAAGHNSGGVSDYEILGAEIYDTVPGDRDRFAFLAQMRFTPVDFPNAHWAAGGGVEDNGDGTIGWETQIALARNADNVWRITSHGWAVKADASGEGGWYSSTEGAAPLSPLTALSGETVSPDGRWKLFFGYGTENEDMWMITLYDAKTGRVGWEEPAWYGQTALWSPDSRYAALTRTARRFTEIILVDTTDFSTRAVPLPEPPEGLQTAVTNPVSGSALEWLDARTLRCRADFRTDDPESTEAAEFLYTVQ